MRVACAARTTLSQQPRRQEGNDDTQVWPTLDQSSPPVHVRIMVGAQSKINVGALGTLVPPVGKKMVPDYSVAVNDRIRKPLASGYFPLRPAAGERIDKAPLAGARFALTGDLQIGCPS